MAKKIKTSLKSISLEVRTSRNGNDFEIRTFEGEDYDEILDIVWDDPGLDWISLDSLTKLHHLAAEDRKAKRKAAEEAAKLEAEKKAAEEAKRQRRKRIGYEEY